MQLVLASSSRYRRELLDRFGMAFEVDAPEIDESPLPGEAARHLVIRLALAKARAVAERWPGATIVGSDQAAAHGGCILGKPGSVERAVEVLRQLAGGQVEFLTGLAVLNGANGDVTTHVDVTTAHFRQASEQEIRRYVELDRPLDCAGAIRFEGLGPTLLAAVETQDPSAAIGLPLIKLAQMLRREGIDPLA